MICDVVLLFPLNARDITLGISENYIENQNTINNILLILKCFIYIVEDVREKFFTYTEVLLHILYQNRKKLPPFIYPPKEQINKLETHLIRYRSHDFSYVSLCSVKSRF